LAPLSVAFQYKENYVQKYLCEIQRLKFTDGLKLHVLLSNPLDSDFIVNENPPPSPDGPPTVDLN